MNADIKRPVAINQEDLRKALQKWQQAANDDPKNFITELSPEIFAETSAPYLFDLLLEGKS